MIKGAKSLTQDEQKDLLHVKDYLKEVSFDEIPKEKMESNTFLKDFWKQHCEAQNEKFKKLESSVMFGWPIRSMYLKFIRHYVEKINSPVSDALCTRFYDYESTGF